MSFSGEDRQEVFFFFETILRSYKEPVPCENLRGHVSKAPVNVRKYVLTKCKGDNFLEYFKRRKNYFNVENGKISLKEEFGNEQLGNSRSNKSKKKKVKFVRKNTSFSHSSYASALKGTYSNKDGEKVYETDSITYFRNLLIRKKKERLWVIESNDLPKKVKRHLLLYHRCKVRNFLSDHSDKFVIDSDDESVSLVHVSESTNATNSSLVDKEPSANLNQNSVDNTVDLDIKNASEYLECVVFFIDLLKKLNQPFPIEKLGGYFSQARKDIKDHVKLNYRSFKYFFDDAPLIFLKNASEEISLSKEYRKFIEAAENLIKRAKSGSTLPLEIPLKLHIIHIFRPQISSRRSSAALEETNCNNEVLPFEDMKNADDDIVEEILTFRKRDRKESEMSIESTDDFFDNYLMCSTSRESSVSLSSRSARSISIEHSLGEDCSVIKNTEKFGSNAVQNFNDKEIMENTFLKCLFAVELFCLEFIESELDFIRNNESKAIEYFMEILDSSSTKLWRLTSLQGSIGNNREIAHFMNKLYKGEKFASFFEKHPQFEVDPPFVKVALFDKTNSTEDSVLLLEENYVVENLENVYELSDFKILLKETYAFLYDLCKFCEDKADVKVDRVSGILSRFPNCLNMMKSLKGQSLAEKIEHFLHETMLFRFPKKGSIYFPYEIFYKKCRILFTWFEKIDCYDPSLEFVSFSDFWTINVYSRSESSNSRKNHNGYTNLEECYQNVVYMIEEEAESRSELSYHELPRIIPENVLFSLTNGNYYSKPLISALLESGNFIMKDGKISLQKSPEDCSLVPSDNKDNGPTENLSEFENHISEESSKELYNQQNLIDNNLVGSSCSPDNSNDISNHSKEYQANACSNQSSKLLQTTENCEIKEIDFESPELKSNLPYEDGRMSINHPLITHGQIRDFNPMNENHAYMPLKESFVQKESERCMNVIKAEENSSLDALTDPENSNPTEETVVSTKTSKSVLNYKTSDSVEQESKYVDKSSDNYYRYEGEVNSKTGSPLHNCDIQEVSFQLPPFPEFELQKCKKEDPNLSSASGSTNLLSSNEARLKKLCFSREENKFLCDQILSLQDLNTNYITPLTEKCDNSVPSEIKSLCANNSTKHNTELEVAGKNGAELNIKASKGKQNMSFTSEEEKSPKFGIDLFSKQNSNDIVPAKTEIMKEKQLNKSELPNKDAIVRVFEQPADKNRNLDDCKASDETEVSLQKNVPQNTNFNDTKGISVPVPNFKRAPQKIHNSEELHVTNKNKNISTEHSFTYTTEELFDTSLMKLYLSPEKISEERDPGHDVESEERNAGVETPLGYPSVMLSPPNDETSKVSRTSSCNDLSSEYPMQPITAKVVLLTNSSCIALADIKKYKKNIYFLKYAFTCEHEDDCSECFSSLQIGDEISCFVPLNEISQKIWIAFMVTKDNSDNVSELGIFDKLKESAKAICEGSTKYLSISAQIKRSACHFGCQTEIPKCDNYSQTDLNGVVDLYKTTKETSCQTRSVTLKSVFVQTENLTVTSATQTGTKNTVLQTMCTNSHMYMNGDFDEDFMFENASYRNGCQGEATQSTKNVSCQTFSTGQIINLTHHPM